jgi:integrase/recombinase XerD
MRLPVVLTREECRQLMTAFKTGKHAFRNNLISRLLYSTGLRIEELANLRFCDICYETKTVFVRSGKGEKDRYACADSETLRILKEWQGEKAPEASVIGLTLRHIRRIVEEAGRLTGISQKYEAMGRVFSPHSYRHAFATHCYENGMRILTLKKLLGHEYLGTTEIYIFTAMKYDVEEYRRTNPMGNMIGRR